MSLVLPLLHISTAHAWVPKPYESHAVFGAAFVLLGVLLVVECLAGGVWHRSIIRTLMFPATLVVLGCGMVAVTAIEPQARLAHFAMGVPLGLGGWAEARVRLGLMKRRYADMLLVCSLLFASLETALFHLGGSGPTGVKFAHGALVTAGFVIAGLRLYQGMEPRSMSRSLFFATAIVAVGMVLFFDAAYQPSPGTGAGAAVSTAPGYTAAAR